MNGLVGDGLVMLCAGVIVGAGLCFAAEVAGRIDDAWAAHRARQRRRAVRRAMAEAETISLVDWARRAS